MTPANALGDFVPGLPRDLSTHESGRQFRKLGFIVYNGGLKVSGALLSVVLHD